MIHVDSGGCEGKIIFWFGSMGKRSERGDEYSIYGPQILNKSTSLSIVVVVLFYHKGGEYFKGYCEV